MAHIFECGVFKPERGTRGPYFWLRCAYERAEEHVYF
jgi:hypothetical protein